MSVRTRICASLALAALSLPARAGAQPQAEIAPEVLREKALTATATATARPWTLKATVGATGNVTHSDQVVGAVDGLTLQFGVVLNASAVYQQGPHGWESALVVQHAQTKTPQLDAFVKSIDNLELNSTYFYRLSSPRWFGPFARFKLQTQLFRGYSVRAEPVTVLRLGKDGVTPLGTEQFPAQGRVALNRPLEPLVLRESVGAFANPIEGEALVLKAKLGGGAQQIVTRDGFVVADVAGTPELELRQLAGVSEAGAELELSLSGVVVKEVVTWKLQANLFLPLLSSSDLPLEGLDRLNTDLAGGISMKLSKWLSADYVLTVRRIPTVVDAFQIQNGLLLTAGFSIL